MARNAASPSVMKMSPTGLPAAAAMTSSASANSAESSPASSAPTVDLPAPGGPMRIAAGPLGGPASYSWSSPVM